MIKVNLLDSITDRQKSVAAIETKITNPRTQTKLMAMACGALLVLGIVFTFVSVRAQNNTAKTDLAREEQIAVQMAAVNKEQTELDKKTKDVQARIGAIQKLRAAQQGPVAVLSAINQRLPNLNNFWLESVNQKEGDITIKGDSPNEMAVTQFGRSLEFSSGLFTNVSIEIQRRLLESAQPVDPAAVATPKSETVGFTVKCKYTVPGTAAPTIANPAAAPAAVTTTATTTTSSAVAATNQVAKQ